MNEEATCRGSIALGSGCKKCRKCEIERKNLMVRLGITEQDLQTGVSQLVHNVPQAQVEPWYGHRFKEVKRGVWRCEDKGCDHTLYSADPRQEQLLGLLSSWLHVGRTFAQSGQCLPKDLLANTQALLDGEQVPDSAIPLATHMSDLRALVGGLEQALEAVKALEARIEARDVQVDDPMLVIRLARLRYDLTQHLGKPQEIDNEQT